jgi:drug/metabolite transporter (DMT)-like permease
MSSSLCDKLSLVFSPFLFALAIIIAKIALNDGVDIHTFNAIRNTLAFLLTYLFRNRKCGVGRTASLSNCDYNFMFWSGLCGLSNALGMTCSAVALAHLNTAMFSFMLGLTVVMTPLLSHFLPFKSSKLQTLGWFAVCLSIVGTLVLEGCAEDLGACFVHGSWYSAVALGAALFYSLYAYLIGLGSESVEPGFLTQGALCVSCVALTCILLFTSGLETHDESPFLGHFHITPRRLLCVGGVAALEAVAWQCEARAVVAVGSSKAAMAIATEAPMTTLLAYIILKESLSMSQYMGCLLVFLAAVVASYDGHGEKDPIMEQCDSIREEQVDLLRDGFENDINL